MLTWQPFLPLSYRVALERGQVVWRVARNALREVTVKSGPVERNPRLRPAEVAAMFPVDPKTVTRWTKAGQLTAVRIRAHTVVFFGPKWLRCWVKATTASVACRKSFSCGVRAWCGR